MSAGNGRAPSKRTRTSATIAPTDVAPHSPVPTVGSTLPVDHHHGHSEPADHAHVPGCLEDVALDAEEEALAKERELAEKERADRKRKRAMELEKPTKLDDAKLHKLAELLNKSHAYSSFLTEQLLGGDGQGEAGATEPGAPGNTLHIERLLKTKTVEEVQADLTPLLEGGTLKHYQLKGISWLMSLWHNGVNGILADEMGLGKTVQTIGLMSHLVSKNVHGPFLIVGPLSTLANWVFEIETWCPRIKALLYHGTKEELQALRTNEFKAPGTPDFPAVVTAYEIIIADRKFLQRFKWKYIVVDEGHRLKNFNCRLIRELRQIPAENKLLLTGTPLQNNLTELWSLLNFILPEIFDKLEQFEDWFDFGDMVTDAGGKRRKVRSISSGRTLLANCTRFCNLYCFAV